MGLFSKTKVEKVVVIAGNGGKARARAEEHLALFNCITSEYKQLSTGSLTFGSEPGSDVSLGGTLMEGVRIKLKFGAGKCLLAVEAGKPDICVDGTPTQGGFFGEGGGEHTLQIGSSYFFLLKSGSVTQLRDWKDGVSKARWFLNSWASKADYDDFQMNWGKSVEKSAKKSTKNDVTNPPPLLKYRRLCGPVDFTSMVLFINSKSWSQEIAIVNLEGSEVAFTVEQMMGFTKRRIEGPLEGSLRCPRCGGRFNIEDMLVVHPSRYGDEVLGEGELQRFEPNRFGADSRPLDEDGKPCGDWACPHCRGKLPQGFHDSPVHIFSLVGDSMAGKSYYLTIAIRQLKRILIQQFNVNFNDADASENTVLNEMIATLFNATSAEGAVLKKTELAGATYKTLTRNGEKVSLPQPFAYRALHNGSGAATFIIYDNAGENFRPDVPEGDKAALTEHMAWSSSLLFLFDPVQQIDLLRMMDAGLDPQIGAVRSEKLRCDQDVILSEIGGRLREWKGLRGDEKSQTPVAIIVGKYDLWEQLLPKSELRTDLCSIENVNGSALLHNSGKVREMMMEYCPEIVAAAEMISTNVRYFPVSAFGCPAVKFRDGASQVHFKIGPDPTKLKPFLVEAPILWAMSQIKPQMLRSI